MGTWLQINRLTRYFCAFLRCRDRLQEAVWCRNPFRSQENPETLGLKKNKHNTKRRARQNQDKKGELNQDNNKVQKIQAEYDELYFISDINIISWFRDTKLCLTDVAV